MKLRTLFFAVSLMVACAVSQARAVESPGMATLSEPEMAQLCGGLELPNGINLNIGIDNQVSINGHMVADAQFSINGTTVSTSRSGVTQINGLNGSTDIQQLSALGQTIIANTASNLTLAQQRTINVDITNMSRINMQALNGIAAIQAQAMFGLRNGFH
jgi:hypothetical protein